MAFSSMTTQSKGYRIGTTEWDQVVNNFAELGDAGTAGTATIGGTGWAIGNGTAEFSYRELTKWFLGRFYLQSGSTTTEGSGGLEFTLPNSVTTINEPQAVTVVVYDDSGTSIHDASGIALASATKIITNVTSTSPITFTTSDLCVVEFCLEKA